MSTVLAFTSYKGQFQVAEGGPLVVFDAMWPAGMWRQGFEKLFAGVDWESDDGPINFVELVGHTADNKAYWLVGSYNEPTPRSSHTERVKEIVTLGGPGEKVVADILKRDMKQGTTTEEPPPVPAPTMNYDDFPVVFTF